MLLCMGLTGTACSRRKSSNDWCEFGNVLSETKFPCKINAPSLLTAIKLDIFNVSINFSAGMLHVFSNILWKLSVQNDVIDKLCCFEQ